MPQPHEGIKKIKYVEGYLAEEDKQPMQQKHGDEKEARGWEGLQIVSHCPLWSVPQARSPN